MGALARLSLLKSALLLNDTGTSNDSAYSALLLQASALASRYCRQGGSLESTAYTDELYSGTDALSGPRAYGYGVYAARELWLRNYPVTALTTVKIWDGVDSFDTESSSYYELINSRYIQYPKLGQEGNAAWPEWPCHAPNNIKISYTAGYTTTDWATALITAAQLGTVPLDLEMAVASLAAWLYRHNPQAGIKSESAGPYSTTYADVIGGASMPAEIAAMLDAYVLVDL